jgi:hypothetical protein
MPNCFTLTRKSDLDAGPVPLAKIDEEMCVFFAVAVDPMKYYLHWFDLIGFRLAIGHTFEEIISDSSERLKPVARWLQENFTPNVWAERGRAMS